jgi:AcrR family transcriptional regulator
MPITPKARGRHHHGDLRRALLDAVAEIVLEAGPEAVTLRECARRAGVSHSAATPHFGDKRGLLTAFAIERSDRLRAAMETAVAALPDSADARTVLAATGHGYMRFAREDPAHFRLMFRTDLIDTTNPAWREAASGARLPLDRAMAVLLPGADARTMRVRLALAWAAVHGFCTLRTELPGSSFWTDEVAEDFIALLVAACTLPA